MSLLDAFRHRLRSLFWRREFEGEMAEEFHHHLELQEQELAGGANPTARSRARFGSQTYYMEETRQLTPLRWLDALGQDLRYTVRNLRRAPGFTAVAVLSLAIGIGANTAIFGLLCALLLQPLPVAHPEQLVEVQHTGPGAPNDAFSYAEYQALRQSPGFTNLTALGGTGNIPIIAGSVRRSVGVDAVTGNFFATIGIRPLRGRLIVAEDERTVAPVVVISEALWAELFNRAPAAIGSTITMHDAAFTVIGVVPKSYQGLAYAGSFETAIPLSTLALAGGPPVETASASEAMLQIVGRLADQASAAAVAGTVAERYRACCVAQQRVTGAGVASGIGLTSIAHGITSAKFDVTAMFGRLLLELLGCAAIVLLAACANLGTLLLARAAARERELAVRLSLGASRRRLAVQMLVESSVLATIGSVAGLLLAALALRLIAHHLPGPIVERAALHLNGTVLGFTAAVAVAAVFLFGGVPAWRATRTSLIGGLNLGGRSSAARQGGVLDRSVVVAQVVIALVLVNGAGLFVATLRNLRAVDGGFATTRVVSTGLDARGTSYENTGLIPLADRLLARAAAIPGVRSAAISAVAPVFGGRQLDADIAVEGYTPSPDERMDSWLNPVTPGFFGTVGIGLRQGRDFSSSDGAGGQQVVIVNEAFVHRYMRERNPLGMSVRMATPTDTILMQVVGVVGDARYLDLRQPALPMMYVPLVQIAHLPRLGQVPVLGLTVRTSGDNPATPLSLRNVVRDETPGLVAGGAETIEAALDDALNRETLTAELATLFGAVALILAAIGLYGVVSYQVARRTREIGVRMALGSTPSRVVWLVLRQALVLAVTGVLVGTPLAFAGGKVIAAELFGLAGQNGFFVLGAGVLLLGTAVAASVVPARWAAKIDPMIALRAD